ncbi:MAG TPA: DciA family protein [Mycobacteriales bacterium]|nr:DciA family protein [Mycobacteriales bacterium]
MPDDSDLPAAALDAARTAARKSARPRRGSRRQVVDPGDVRGGYSSSGVDHRDPQKLSSLVRRLVNDRGWEKTAASAGVMGRWEEIVGPEIADHARPLSLRDGELVLVAESTAWATQLRLLVPRIQARLSAEVGAGVVTGIRVQGPATPSWKKGPRRFAGRGPRDTYG